MGLIPSMDRKQPCGDLCVLLLDSKWGSIASLHVRSNTFGDVSMLNSVVDRIIVALQLLRQRLKLLMWPLKWPRWPEIKKSTQEYASDASRRDGGGQAQSDEFISPWGEGANRPRNENEQLHKDEDKRAEGESLEDEDASHSTQRNRQPRDEGGGRRENAVLTQTGIEIIDILIPLFLVIGVGFLVVSIFGSPFGGWFVIGGVMGMAGRDILERSKRKKRLRQVHTKNIYKIITLFFLVVGIWFLFDPELGWFFAASFIAVGIIGIAGWDIIPVILFFFIMSFALWLNSIFKFGKCFKMVDFIKELGDFIEMLVNSI